MRIAHRIVVPALAALLLTGCGASTADRYKAGEAAFAQNRYQAARTELAAVVRDDPDNIAAMDRLVRTYLALEDPIAAAGLLDRMARGGRLPGDAPALYGETDLMKGHFDAALSRVTDAHSTDAHRVRALAFIGLDAPEDAADAFEAGLRSPGNKSRLAADYASFLFERREFAKAREMATLAAREKPRALESYIVSADFARMEGRIDLAAGQFDTALKLFPESRVALIGKIAALGDLGRLDEAAPLIERAHKAAPGDLDFLYMKARLAAERGDWIMVRQLLQPRENDLAKQSLAQTLYAKALIELNLAEQARIVLNSQLLREPDNRQARVLLAEAKIATGDALGAVETLEPVAGRDDASTAELELMVKAARLSNHPDAPRYQARIG